MGSMVFITGEGAGFGYSTPLRADAEVWCPWVLFFIVPSAVCGSSSVLRTHHVGPKNWGPFRSWLRYGKHLGNCYRLLRSDRISVLWDLRNSIFNNEVAASTNDSLSSKPPWMEATIFQSTRRCNQNQCCQSEF